MGTKGNALLWISYRRRGAAALARHHRRTGDNIAGGECAVHFRESERDPYAPLRFQQPRVRGGGSIESRRKAGFAFAQRRCRKTPLSLSTYRYFFSLSNWRRCAAHPLSPSPSCEHQLRQPAYLRALYHCMPIDHRTAARPVGPFLLTRTATASVYNLPRPLRVRRPSFSRRPLVRLRLLLRRVHVPPRGGVLVA